MEGNKNIFLQYIAQYLILESSFLKDLGLLNGKMGIALFFFHYAKYMNKNIYSDFGGELVDEIYNEISIDSPLNFKSGLAGIAWGIEYLVRNNFVEADSNKILEDIDKKILEWDVRRINDISLESGLMGLVHYVTLRCANRNRSSHIIPNEYITDLLNALKPRNNKSISTLKSILEEQKILYIDNPLVPIIKSNIDKLPDENSDLSIGNNGLAGIGFNLMNVYEEENIYI